MSLNSEFESFGEFLPDLHLTNNPGLPWVKNVSARANGYGPVQGFAPPSGDTGLTGRALATHWSQFADVKVFAADATRLYLKSPTGWDDKSQGGTAYSPAASQWQFVSFGPHVVAVAANIPPQRYNVATATDTTEFEDLPNAPNAEAVGIVRDFLVLGNTDLGENYINWSGFNNIETYASSLSTQADFQPLQGDAGPIVRIISGSTGFIFRQRAIHSMNYVGPSPIFRIDDEFGVGRGTEAPRSVIKLGSMIYYYDHAGFFMLDTRSKSFKAIGHERVDRYINGEVPPECLKNMQSTVDPVRKNIIWSMCTNKGAFLNDLQMVYNYALDRWTLWEIPNELIASVPTSGTTLEQLDTIPPGLADIDMHTVSFDSDTYAGGSFTLSAFDGSHVLRGLDGPPLDAEFQTREFWVPDKKRIKTNQQRVFVEGSSATRVECILNTRDTPTGTIVPTLASEQDNFGYCHANARAQFLSIFVTVRGGFTHCTGVSIFKRIA